MTLVLGMPISVAALRHMLPAKAADVLQAKEFRLMQVNFPLRLHAIFPQHFCVLLREIQHD